MFPACSPIGNECYQKLDQEFDCKVTCNGLFADVNIKSDIVPYILFDGEVEWKRRIEENPRFKSLLKQLNEYKKNFLENLRFEGYNNIDSTYSE